MMLDIVRGLNKLDRLEAFAAPHALCDAREVFATWLSDSPSAAVVARDDFELATAA
jgi:hypothetical protein